MQEKFDLDELWAEIKEDEEFEIGSPKGPVTQTDIQKLIQARLKKAQEKP